MSVRVSGRAINVSRNLVSENLRMYDKLMRERPSQTRECKPACEDCPYYHPDWEHRFCLYTKCMYGKKIDVFDMKRLGKKQNACASVER